MLAALTMVSSNASAGNINANAARAAANSFLKQQSASVPGSFKAATYADLKLAHAEASKVNGANAYYAFNINGGGFIIIAGEDRAATVLGYSDKGHLDFKNLPSNLKALLDGYKSEIEFLQTYEGNDLEVVTPSIKASTSVDPLIKTTWGQEIPYCLQCPMENGEYCVVGCVATAMAQVMYYWKFPTSSDAISGYGGGWWGGVTVPALPATTFDYSLMLDSYCHWDYNTSTLVQDTYTDEQAQEVAKLSRYCGQAVEMDYDPEGSGAYTWDQLQAMIDFGYSSTAQDVSKNGWSSSYTTAQWEAMMKEELAAGRPILYSASDPSAGGHAFICDGYNADGYFHFNLGWYGTCDGWYLSTSLRMVHRDGEQLNFSSGHEMLTGVEPPTYCMLDVEAIDADNELLVLGDNLTAVAQNMTLRTSYRNVKLIFNLADMDGNNVVSGNEVNVAAGTFVQGSNINGTITLPTTLAEGKYNLNLTYYTTIASEQSALGTASGQLQVIGHLAKYNAPFTIEDVTTVIDYLLDGSKPGLTINDVTDLIDNLLGND